MKRTRPFKMRQRFWSEDAWTTTAYAHAESRNKAARQYAACGWDVEIWNGNGRKDALPAAPNPLRERMEANKSGTPPALDDAPQSREAASQGAHRRDANGIG